MESSARLITPSVTPNNDALTRNRKNSSTVPAMPNSQISMFKLTTSAGNSIDQPVRPGDRFSGVLVVQLSRPISATQVVLELTASERWATTLKGTTRPERTHIFACSLVLWRAMRNGAANASTVLSDGLHVFNFSCQIPNLNYPQNVHCGEFEIGYLLEARLMAPKDYGGGEHIAGRVVKDMFFTPLVVLVPNLEPLVVSETLYFEKKGKRGKPAVEMRAAINNRQLLPGSKAKIDVSIKELASSSWTRIMVRLFESTRCRISTQMPFSQPLWSAERELVHTEVVRSSVYSYFINDDMMGKPTTETKTATGETITNESLVFNIPPIPVGAMSTDHLEFTHFIRIEVVIPSWMSSDRSVHLDIPVQMITCEITNAARFLSRRGSIPSIERKSENDNSSVVSSKSGSSGLRSAQTTERSLVMSEDTLAMVINSLPPRYCDVPIEQRQTPSLMFVKQSNMNQMQQQDHHYQQQQQQQQQQQAMRQHGMTSIDGRSSSSANSTLDDFSKERYRSRPLPMAPGQPGMQGGNPPPLPAEPMPVGMPTVSRPPSSRTQMSGRREGQVQQVNINVQQSMRVNPLVLSPYDPNDPRLDDDSIPLMRGESPISGSTGIIPEDSYSLASSKMREHTSHLHTPISPPYNNGSVEEFHGDDAGYFKESSGRRPADREYVTDNMYPVRKTPSLKQYR
ncbi:hypothetical protein IWW36_003001 [Coemansia brasiliensis]|uniref:Arrestin C-terminal-like domain-containing protein n=1 Tax=Coemansia brasiliensis TaxID=2650707 RepID=A0A9W8I651_9FUNG|nr:hypothetical protein IWW36_003001 [Coemansia brasiliensis]